MVEIPQRAIRQPKRRTDTPGPPLIEMIAAGRGGADVRIRIYLWLFALLSTRGFGDLDLKRTTGEWATLVNVMPDGSEHNQGKRVLAARRVGRALTYLEECKLIGRPEPGVIRLLDPDRSGRDYQPWTQHDRDARERERDRIHGIYLDRTDLRRGAYWEDNPLRLPATLWTSGTISGLPAPALVVLLVLWDYERGIAGVFDIPKSRPYEYPLSHATWHRGTTELERLGLITRHLGALVFPGTNTNPKMHEDRHRVRWALNHTALEAPARR
jgi:hypothetical protein